VARCHATSVKAIIYHVSHNFASPRRVSRSLYSGELKEHKTTGWADTDPSFRQTQYLLFERSRLTRALQQLYKKTLSGDPWPGEPVTELASEGPSIHEILQRLEGGPSLPNLPDVGRGSEEANDVLKQTPHQRMAPQPIDTYATPLPVESRIPKLTLTSLGATDGFYAINSSNSPFSTTSPVSACPSGLFPEDDPLFSCDIFVDDLGFPPWMFYTQPVEFLGLAESNRA
jgi:hypothetical protein